MSRKQSQRCAFTTNSYKYMCGIELYVITSLYKPRLLPYKPSYNKKQNKLTKANPYIYTNTTRVSISERVIVVGGSRRCVY